MSAIDFHEHLRAHDGTVLRLVVPLFIICALCAVANAQPAAVRSSALVVPGPYTLITETVPANGALVLRFDPVGGQPRIGDSEGNLIAGEFTYFSNEDSWVLLAFVPTSGWTAGVEYRVEASSQMDIRFTVTLADDRPLVVPDAAVSLSVIRTTSVLQCTDRPGGNIVISTLEDRTTGVSLKLASVDLKSEEGALRSGTEQIILLPVINGVRVDDDLQFGRYTRSFPDAAPYVPSACVAFEALDLRTMTRSLGRETCVENSVQLGTEHFELGDALDIARCPYPISDHVIAWCAYNRAHCSVEPCANYSWRCGGSSPAPNAGHAAEPETQRTSRSGCNTSPAPCAFYALGDAAMVLCVALRRRRPRPCITTLR